MRTKQSKTAKILKLLAEGKSVKVVAAKVGTTPNYVYYVKWNAAKKAEKPVKAKKVSRKQINTTAQALESEVDGFFSTPKQPEQLPLWESLEAVDPLDPYDTQVGGDHYKSMAIQPMEYSMVNKLDPCQHTIVKYVSRFRNAGGIEDLEKAKHVIDLLIQFEREDSQSYNAPRRS